MRSALRLIFHERGGAGWDIMQTKNGEQILLKRKTYRRHDTLLHRGDHQSEVVH
jgi:hypothetical protein